MTSSNYISIACVDYEDLGTGTHHEGHWRAERNLGIITIVHLQHICEISMTIISLEQDRCRANSKLCRNRLDLHYNYNMRKY